MNNPNKQKFRKRLKECPENMRLHMIRKNLKKKLTPERYEHTLRVASTCQCLAMSLGEDISHAYLAGLLHDCAKDIPDAEQIARCRKQDIPITDIEYKSPYLLHAKLGAHLAKKKYGVKDKEICSAIECHTTGKPKMTTLEMILFVADYIEPGRDKAKNLTELRKEAFRDLRHCAYLILYDTLTYLKEKGNPIDEMTEKTYNYYRKFYEN